MSTLFVTHESCRDHFLPSRPHPERPERIEAVWEVLEARGLLERITRIPCLDATDEDILRVHTQDHLDTLDWINQQQQIVMIDSDTYALPYSVTIARRVAGGVVQAVKSVMNGDFNNGLVAVRPPGHHATDENAMGFCLINNVAVGAQYAIDETDAKRVMIVDYDVHHGNGTQDIFYSNPDVLFLSTHQSPFYPGTGHFEEIGIGVGKGSTVNIPLPEGVGDQGYDEIFEKLVTPVARRFKPDLILVSAGFDAHFVDPLASMQLSMDGYVKITRHLITLADELCDGRIVFVMEGGYDLKAISYGMANIAHCLLGDKEIGDPYGVAPSTMETNVTDVIQRVKAIHSL